MSIIVICDHCKKKMKPHEHSVVALRIAAVWIGTDDITLTDVDPALEPQSTFFCSGKCLVEWSTKNVERMDSIIEDLL